MNSQKKFIRVLPLLTLAALLFSCGKPSETPVVIKTFTLDQGDTLGESLRESGLSNEQRTQIISNLGKIMPVNKCHPGDRYEIVFSSPESYTSFSYFQPGLDYYSVENTSSGVIAEKRTRNAKKLAATATGSITTSLWESMTAKGISADVILDFADIFAWQIDFLTEPRVGDNYKLIFEQYAFDDGTTTTKNGEILAAQYTASGQTYTAFLF